MTRLCLNPKCREAFHSLRRHRSRCWSCGGITVRWRPGIETNPALFPKSKTGIKSKPVFTFDREE